MASKLRLTTLLLLVGSGIVGYVLHYVGAFSPLLQQAKVGTREEWIQVGPSPGGVKEYPPQGMTMCDGSLTITNHWNGDRSGIYRVDPETGETLAEATMPPEAKHTSGLAWDGEWLWAIDHESNLLYRIYLEQTFEDGQAAVEHRYETGLRGSSGLTIAQADGSEFFVISDFLWTIETTPSLPVGSAKTYIVPRDRIEAGDSVQEAAIFSYSNGGYSQGVTWDGEYLYESLNNLGTDRIEILDISEVLEGKSEGSFDRIGSFEGPASRIEDLGTDGERIWTTDEGTYKLYRLNSLSQVRVRATQS